MPVQNDNTTSILAKTLSVASKDLQMSFKIE